MAKVSHMRVREEIERGFDILSNDKLKPGLTQMHATNFMKKQTHAWDRLNATGQIDYKGATGMQQQSTADANIDFNANRFATRAVRLDTTKAKT